MRKDKDIVVRRALLGGFAMALLIAVSCGSAVTTPQNLSQTFASIAEEVSPAVVHIATVRVLKPGGPGSGAMPPFGDEFFDRFFRFPTPRGEYRQQGLGSGVIVSDDGYVLTNNHVVEGAEELKVKLSDEREFDAKVVGTDPDTDIAVLKIDAKNLPIAELGNSDKIKVGHLVLALGSPFGLDRSVTFGIISAKGRAGMGITEYEDFIQTDAAPAGPGVHRSGADRRASGPPWNRSRGWRHRGVRGAQRRRLCRRIATRERHRRGQPAVRGEPGRLPEDHRTAQGRSGPAAQGLAPGHAALYSGQAMRASRLERSMDFRTASTYSSSLLRLG